MRTKQCRQFPDKLWYFVTPWRSTKIQLSKEAQKFVVKGQYDKAIAEWKKLLKVTPDDPNIYNTIGDLCLKKNAKVGAVEAYHKAADLLASDGFTSKAIALYKKVLNIDPKKIEAHLALADMNAEKASPATPSKVTRSSPTTIPTTRKRTRPSAFTRRWPT